MISIRSQKITIRDWKAKYEKPFRFWNTGKHEWMKFNGPYYPQKNLEEVEAQMQVLQAALHTPDQIRQRLVIADLETDILIGTVSWYWQSQETHWLSLGIAIYDNSFWGKGIGQDALTIWCQYLFDAFPEIVRLDLRTWSGNPGMMALAKKLGFQQEACFRKARIVNGAYYDSIGYGILRAEWEGR